MTQVQGWNSTNPTFKELIDEVKPKTIIEVGSWKGASVIHMASLCDAKFYCVDTWLGSFEHHRDGWIPFGAYPNLIEQFWNNTSHIRDRITILPMTSSIGARVLSLRGIKADLIYIDGSHDYVDVSRDLVDYWPLVNEGGALFGDDWGEWESVRQAVQDFPITSSNIPMPRVHHGQFWSFKK